jgi:hypothetical protein
LGLWKLNSPDEELEALRSAVREIGVKRVARESKIGLRNAQEFLNDGTTPHKSTIAKIKAALKRLGISITPLASETNV